MRVAPDNDLLTRSTPSDGDSKTAHRGTWKEDGSLFVEVFSNSGLKEVGGWVISKDIVSDFCLAHGLEHTLRCFRKYVTSEVDE
jgi:hypothetical protein